MVMKLRNKILTLIGAWGFGVFFIGGMVSSFANPTGLWSKISLFMYIGLIGLAALFLLGVGIWKTIDWLKEK
jgi:predicted transporter